MRLWLREIAGWLSMALGLFGFYVCFVLVLHRQIVEAGALTFVAIVLFRGGIHLLKVAMAARILLDVHKLQAEDRPPAGRVIPPARTASRPLPAKRPAS